VSRVVLTKIKVHLLAAQADGSRLPQYAIAAKMSDILGYHFHPYTLSQYALGKLEMPLDRREALAKVLGISPEELIGSQEFDV